MYYIYPYLFIYVILWAFFHKYQFLDLRLYRNIVWKKWRVIISVFTLVPFFLPEPHLTDLLLSCSLNWLTFELAVNKISLNKPLLYVGIDGKLESIKNKKWLLILATILLSLIIKITWTHLYQSVSYYLF